MDPNDVEAAGKKFKYTALAALGSWKKPSRKDADNDETPVLMATPKRTLTYTNRQGEEAIGIEEAKEAGEEPSGEEGFIPLLDSPPRWRYAEPPAAQPSAAEWRQAQQEAVATLARHRRKWMPWMSDTLDRISSPLLRLHNEITDFVKLVTPTEEEKKDREDALQRTRELVNAIWPNAELKVFGSYATDLYLPT
eukprot:CAMPEP_0177781534 /NCGR_PEP_ID=MMETSP0491_2-20121128/17914_1 /TAXON_ID=63592 /ORGANISM="Tetraselmis chuii, Strain PLY429" /LENGTH=193 /DNA_ID=CAMNT_0019301631 /DNA_START=25 /DNA_END=603 /DNA_ORIENTATION=+